MGVGIPESGKPLPFVYSLLFGMVFSICFFAKQTIVSEINQREEHILIQTFFI